MVRKYFENGNRKLSYIDYHGKGEYIIMLHGHFGCASMYSQLAGVLKQFYRVIALDQQGHGFSDWGQDYTRDEYLDDLAALYGELKINEAVIIGHSLGGVNGYQFAAKNPSMVKSLIIEDIGTTVSDDLSFVTKWPDYFTTVRQWYHFFIEQGIDNVLYFMESLEQTEYGWRLGFDTIGLVRSQIELNGDWNKDWLNVKCNILLMRGSESTVLSRYNANQLLEVTPEIKYREFEGCGHTIRDKDFEGYKNAILEFLNKK